MGDVLETIKTKAVVIGDGSDVKDEILSLVGDASHGTHEFCKYRAEITRRLIQEKQFPAVAVEADFPDAYRVNRFVQSETGKDKTAIKAVVWAHNSHLGDARATDMKRLGNFFLDLQDEETKNAFKTPILERAIGVIYRLETERVSHYFYADVPDQFDGIIHFDTTRAVGPLDRVSSRTHEDVPETFPEGI